MVRRVAYQAAVIGLGLALAGCGFGYFGFEQRAAWRDREERACMASRPSIVFSAYVVADRAVDGRGACGIDKPLKIAAFGEGSLLLRPDAVTLGCPMAAALEEWLTNAVQPAAIAWFGAPVVAVRQMGAYSCRPRNNQPGEDLSEHAFGNAIDVAGFTLASGRTVTVKADWNGLPDARRFLREVLSAACERFKTVLGPGVRFHGDHFHLDLAHHGRDGTDHVCRPAPDMQAPRRSPVRPDLIARGPLDWGRTGSVPPAKPKILTDLPGDIIRQNLADPFGAYKLNPAIAAPGYTASE